MLKKTGLNILIVLLFLSTVAAQDKSTDRPNIILCITDDQSWVHTSFAGEQAIRTPAFDRMAR